MLARIFDKNKCKYYISEVYGVVNCGVDQYIVDSIEDDRESLTLVQYLDFSTQSFRKPFVERISANPSKLPWVYVEKEDMEKFNQRLRNGIHYHYFNGYQFIWEQQERLARLIRNGTVLQKDIVHESITTKLDGWNYIESQEDIDILMKKFSGFHDSVIKELHYISGDYKMPVGGMAFTEAHRKNLQVIFDSDWSESIELIFEAPRLVQLVPPGENYFAELYDASILIKDYMVYFYDTYREDISDSYDGTMIKAMGLRWRYI